MKLQVLHHLNEKQQKKVMKLVETCRHFEPVTLTPPLTPEGCFDEKIPCFYLAYEGNELISFLSLFLPNEAYGEAMAFTHPMARRRGYFKALWNEVLIRLDDYIEDMELLFVLDGMSPDAIACMEHMEGEYQYSESILEKDFPRPEEGSNDAFASALSESGMSLERLEDTAENRAKCAELHEQIFCDGVSAARRITDEQFETADGSVWLLKKGDAPIGLFHLTEWDRGTYLSGFGIHPEEQGKGYGKLLLRAAGAVLPEGHRHMALQVNSLNEAACSLYLGEGFLETSHRDYYF